MKNRIFFMLILLMPLTLLAEGLEKALKILFLVEYFGVAIFLFNLSLLIIYFLSLLSE